MELLLEIGTEEIPAGFLKAAFDTMAVSMVLTIKENRLSSESVKVMATGTPRRLVVVVEGLAERQPDIVEDVTGPPVKAAYDAKGNPTKAATGFAEKMGLKVEELEKVDTPKGPYLKAKRKIAGRPARDVLAEILPKFITSIPWRKAMRWGDGELRFARPIHWILALLDGKVIPFELDGIKSGSKTYGHRFTHPKAIKVKSFDDYKENLYKVNVIVDYIDRRTAVVDGIKNRAMRLGGVPACFDELFDEITNLVEWPVIIDAKFPEHYLEVPDIVLIASMTGHQRYVPLRGKGKKLLPNFITVANTPATDLKVVAHGNERVLNARLADAEYFYKTDLKKSLEEHSKRLEDVLYLKGMGSYADKAKRIESLAGFVAGKIAPNDPDVVSRARRAASLAKADLVTLMVGEFPSLQGQMGGIYARKSGEPEGVAKAIEEHYLPKSAADIEAGNFPRSLEGCAVAIADRADSIAACFALDLTPKGDQDPYALRRAVLGILATVQGNSRNLSIPDLFSAATQGVAANSKKDKKRLLEEMLDFVRERMRYQLLEPNRRLGAGPPDQKAMQKENLIYRLLPDIAEAVLRSGIDDWLEVLGKFYALRQFCNRSDFEDLATSFRRVGNILENFHSEKVDESLFSEPAEKELWKGFNANRDRWEKLASERKYKEALEAMAELRPAVDKFFDEVLVNDPKDPKRRDNRHSLLYAIHRSFLAVADFSAISRPGS